MRIELNWTESGHQSDLKMNENWIELNWRKKERGIAIFFTQFFCHNSFWGKKKAGKTKIASGLYFPTRMGGAVWSFVFHNNKQINQKIHRIPTISFQYKILLSNKVPNWHRKKSNGLWYVSVYVCVFQFVFLLSIRFFVLTYLPK